MAEVKLRALGLREVDFRHWTLFDRIDRGRPQD